MPIAVNLSATMIDAMFVANDMPCILHITSDNSMIMSLTLTLAKLTLT